MDIHDLVARERRNTLAEIAEDLALMERESSEPYATAYRKAKERVLGKIGAPVSPDTTQAHSA